ncbi:MAG: peptidylprolyl isomerase [Desulfuromonadaceae bacterium]|nr:peptidylprolyl isomerase [Desulfuromonas sp.]MDY0185386.1 peptidylprolyl isomerase [Desulfuromonadaceae bacterium]
MRVAKKGDTVKVHYTGRLENGEVFDSSEDKAPLSFIIGQREVIKGFDSAVEGLSVGEEITVTIEAEKGYGKSNQDLIQKIKHSEMPAGLEYSVGNQIEITHQDGSLFHVMVTEITETEVSLDANHPLAGRRLVFTIRMEEIIPAEVQGQGLTGMMIEQLKERRNMN